MTRNSGVPAAPCSPTAVSAFAGPATRGLSSAAAPALFTPVAFLVLGYHPFAGDAGIYVAGIRHILDPTLYPLNAILVTAFTRLSVFAWAIAAMVWLTHLPVAWVLLAAQIGSVFLFLLACGQLAVRLFSAESARWSVTLVAALCAGLPVAGTALPLMDPYVTARSFSTPLALFAVIAVMDRAWIRTCLLLLVAVLIHPLMGAWAIAFVALYACATTGKRRTGFVLCATALTVSGIIFAAAQRTSISPSWREAVSLAPHSFLFISRWRWYEDLGLLLPLLLFAAALFRRGARTPTGALCLTAVQLGATTTLIAALFVRAAGPYALVPLQVLRSFLLIYLVGLVLAAGLPDRFLSHLGRRTPAAAAALFVVAGGAMAGAQHLAWPGSGLIEWPGSSPRNPYEQAFLWIRSHTPRDAVFAFNPQLVYLPEEDEQGFRAIAERDHLADDKDAGIAAVLPRLSDRWARQRNAELSVNEMTDAERLRALAPLDANWLLLPPESRTSFPCPWHNSVVTVCEMKH